MIAMAWSAKVTTLATTISMQFCALSTSAFLSISLWIRASNFSTYNSMTCTRLLYLMYMTESNHVVNVQPCNICFRLVSHHQQGIAHSAYGTTGFYRMSYINDAYVQHVQHEFWCTSGSSLFIYSFKNTCLHLLSDYMTYTSRTYFVY